MGKVLFKVFLLAAFFAAVPLYGQDKDVERIVTQNVLMDAVASLETAPGEAVAKLEYLDSHFAADDAVKYYLGMVAFSSGRLEDAEKYLLQACSLDSTNTWYKDALASVYSARGKNDASADIYMELLEKQPERYSSACTYTVKGDRYLSQYNDSLALDSYEKALAYDPEYAPAVLGRAEVNRIRGNVPGFLADVHSFTLNPAVIPSAKCRYVNNILQNINYPFYRSWGTQLDSLVEGCVRTHPADSSALKLAGSWYYSTDRKEKGTLYFNRLFEEYPRDIKVRYLRIGLLMDGGNMKDVIDECENIINIGGSKNPEIIPALTTAGDCWHAIGNDSKAMKYYDKVLKIDPKEPTTLNNYAYYLSLAGKKLRKAEKMSRIAVEQDPDNPSFLDTLGWILHLRGKDQEAKPYFKRAMVYGGKDHLDVLEHYAVVLEALGDKHTAQYYRTLAENKKAEK